MLFLNENKYRIFRRILSIQENLLKFTGADCMPGIKMKVYKEKI